MENKVDPALESAIHKAIGIQDISTLEALLKGLSKNQKFSEPLLISAIKMNADKAVPLLLQYGADINAQDELGNTALHHAIFSHIRGSLIPLLINAKADIHRKNLKGESVIFAAARNFPDWVEYLHKLGADYNSIDNKGNTLLMHALETDSDSFLIFLSNAANVNQQNNAGETALSLAVKNDKRWAIQRLLIAGADIHQKNKAGETLALIAYKARNYKLLEFLIKSGADSSQVEISKKTDEPLPEFPYYSSDELKNHLKTSYGPCECCKKRNVVFKHGFYVDEEKYTKDDIDYEGVSVCPWCISSGAFYKKFKTPTIGRRDLDQSREKVSPAIFKEFSRTTPGFSSWQDMDWPVHCHLPCKFISYMGWDELEGKMDSIELIGNAAEIDPTCDIFTYFDKDSAPRGYLFECKACHKLLMDYDTD